MAARNLRHAAEAVGRHPQRAGDLGVDEEEVAAWRDAADRVVVPFDEHLGVHPQAELFTRLRPWAFDRTRPDQYPLLLHFPYFALYTSQVVKQADLVLALYLCGDRFTPEEKARDFAYYEAITVRDSSLSACTQAIVAAEVGHLDLAYDYFGETAFIDLRDLNGNSDDGLHIASLAGTWLAAVAGFGGMRDYGDRLAFAPRLPARLVRLTFRLLYRGRCVRVDVRAHRARYEVVEGEGLTVLHHGEAGGAGAGGAGRARDRARRPRPAAAPAAGARAPAAARRGLTRRASRTARPACARASAGCPARCSRR